MRSDLYETLKEETRNEFEILDPIAGGEEWAVFLGRPVEAPARLALLVLQPAEDDDGELDLQIAETLDAGLAIGRTTCLACMGGEQGWPRFCSACGADLTGVGGDAGASAGELLDEVRLASNSYDVLGYMPHTEGGGWLFFVRESGTRRVVGLMLRAAEDGDLELFPSWSPDEAAGDADVVIQDAVQEEPSLVNGAGDPAVPPPCFYDPPEHDPRPGRAAIPRRTAMIVGGALIAAIVVGVLAWNRAHAGPGDASRASTGGIQSIARQNTPAPDTAATGNGSAAETTDPEISSIAEGTEKEEPEPRAPDRVPADVPAPVPTPAPAPPPAPPPAPTAGGITEAIGRYAAAVQSRQVGRISQAYPGITAAELQRWERFFRPLPADAGLQSRYDVLRGPSVNGTRGEILFTLTLSYLDASGKPAELPLPLRGLLTWTGGGWSLDEVRSYP